jgi:histidinol-phosphate aminotransferase
MRSGYLVASPELVNAVITVKNSFNHFPVDALTQTAAAAACSDPGYYADCCRKIVATRDRFSGFLEHDGWEVLPSQTNFVFARKPGYSGSQIYDYLKHNGILVRFFNIPGLTDFVRISIGTDEEMNHLIQVIGAGVSG